MEFNTLAKLVLIEFEKKLLICDDRFNYLLFDFLVLFYFK